MQVVFLSARPDVLGGTLQHFRAHLAWADDILVITPRRLRAAMSGLGVQVVTDDELLGADGPADHSHRNYALRAALATCAAVHDVFLSSDDDSRPLRALPETTWLRGGRFRRYYFGHLDEWEHRGSSFDRCLLASRQVLGLHNLPRVAYASHMPQVVAKELLAEVVDLFEVAARRYPLDEWATYFNAAGALHPDLFEDPEPYVTLGWPEDNATWQAMRDPAALLFENTFLEHYAEGAVFDGIDPLDTSYETAVEKVRRWRDYELAVVGGQRPAARAPVRPVGRLGKALRDGRAATFGDPVQRDRCQRAGTASLLRAWARRT